jgi:hypothetical protein
VSQIIDTPDLKRRYIIDCLLFSPDARKNKYRFMLQLDAILDSFRLTGETGKPGAAS